MFDYVCYLLPCVFSRKFRWRLLATAGCSALGMFGPLYRVTCTTLVYTCFWGCDEWSSWGRGSVTGGGEMMVTPGYDINLVELRGHTLATSGQKGEFF